jgi:uncharacterized protein (TIGR03083 family)
VTESSTSDVLAALHASQSRLRNALDGMTAEQATAQSYDDDWTVADVASHLGSGAELFTVYLEAGLGDGQDPGTDGAQPVWDRWNAKEPLAQVQDTLEANDTFLSRIDALTDEERASWGIDLFGARRDLRDFLVMRLSEHAIHTWDIEVAADPSLPIPADAAAHTVANVVPIAGWVGQKRDDPIAVDVRTTDPELAFRLEIGPDAVSVVPGGGDGEAAATLSLPTEAFVRLVYGRLDAEHTPASVDAQGVDLDVLRATFPGV